MFLGTIGRTWPSRWRKSIRARPNEYHGRTSGLSQTAASRRPERPCGSLSQLTICGAVLRGNILPPVRMPGSMSAIVAGYRFRQATKHLVLKLTLLIRCQMRGLGQGFEKISICRVVRRNQNTRIQQMIDKDAIGFHQ